MAGLLRRPVVEFASLPHRQLAEEGPGRTAGFQQSPELR
jgi:hypothetical protein